MEGRAFPDFALSPPFFHRGGSVRAEGRGQTDASSRENPFPCPVGAGRCRKASGHTCHVEANAVVLQRENQALGLSLGEKLDARGTGF